MQTSSCCTTLLQFPCSSFCCLSMIFVLCSGRRTNCLSRQTLKRALDNTITQRLLGVPTRFVRTLLRSTSETAYGLCHSQRLDCQMCLIHSLAHHKGIELNMHHDASASIVPRFSNICALMMMMMLTIHWVCHVGWCNYSDDCFDYLKADCCCRMGICYSPIIFAISNWRYDAKY